MQTVCFLVLAAAGASADAAIQRRQFHVDTSAARGALDEVLRRARSAVPIAHATLFEWRDTAAEKAPAVRAALCEWRDNAVENAPAAYAALCDWRDAALEAAPADVQMVEVQTGPPVAALAIAAGVVATVAVGGRALTSLTAPADDDDEASDLADLLDADAARADVDDAEEEILAELRVSDEVADFKTSWSTSVAETDAPKTPARQPKEKTFAEADEEEAMGNTLP